MLIGKHFNNTKAKAKDSSVLGARRRRCGIPGSICQRMPGQFRAGGDLNYVMEVGHHPRKGELCLLFFAL